MFNWELNYFHIAESADDWDFDYIREFYIDSMPEMKFMFGMFNDINGISFYRGRFYSI